MAQRSQRNNKGSKMRKGAWFTLLIGLFVLVYILPRIISFSTSKTDQYVIAKSGLIDDSIEFQGVITREEQLFKAVADGVVEYYYPGGRSLSKNTVIATIQDADYYGDLLDDRMETINSKISDISETDSEYSEEFDNLKRSAMSSVAAYLKSKDLGHYDQLYALKDSLSAAVHQRQDLYSLLSSSTARTLLEEQKIYENVNSETSENLWISEAGIISYSYDGYEGWNHSMVKESFFTEYTNSYEYLNINMQKVEQGDPLYRLVTSQDWYITAFITEKQAAMLDPETSRSLTLYDGDRKLSGRIETLEQSDAGRYRLVIRMSSNIVDYLDKRIASFTISRNTYEGMKVPNKCLTSQDFYAVPKNCVFRQGTDYGVMVRTENGDVFSPLVFEWNTDSDYYFEELTEQVHEGTVLLQYNSENDYILGGKVPTAGVYVINGVTEVFKHVEVLYQNDEYSIINGINQYDHVKVLEE